MVPGTFWIGVTAGRGGVSLGFWAGSEVAEKAATLHSARGGRCSTEVSLVIDIKTWGDRPVVSLHQEQTLCWKAVWPGIHTWPSASLVFDSSSVSSFLSTGMMYFVSLSLCFFISKMVLIIPISCSYYEDWIKQCGNMVHIHGDIQQNIELPAVVRFVFGRCSPKHYLWLGKNRSKQNVQR